MIDAHPALKAVSPQAPIADWFIGDDFHHNGAFFLPHAFNFYAGFGQPRPEPGPIAPNALSTTARPTATSSSWRWARSRTPTYSRILGKGIAFWNEMMQHPNYDEFWKARRHAGRT